jgi:salicylate hydroxylase
MSPTASKIRIAISGGGLAGAALARSLLPHAHLDVHIYESAAEFSERGMGIIMAVNAQRALKHIVGGEEEVEEMFKRAGAVTMNSSRIMMVRLHCSSLLLATCSWDSSGASN